VRVSKEWGGPNASRRRLRRLLSMRPRETVRQTSRVRKNLLEALAYASPAVSNMAASIASRAVLPAHTTNWKAGK